MIPTLSGWSIWLERLWKRSRHAAALTGRAFFFPHLDGAPSCCSHAHGRVYCYATMASTLQWLAVDRVLPTVAIRFIPADLTIRQEQTAVC